MFYKIIYYQNTFFPEGVTLLWNLRSVPSTWVPNWTIGGTHEFELKLSLTQMKMPYYTSNSEMVAMHTKAQLKDGINCTCNA